ncbi:hypothetical protein ACQP1G_22155 [Nocardia sp. CA-107356]|uniref:hypothetical protein n=1 Tax=Nocardia sp. CA-107356 TaxID=3239972 RepID=UPI003D8FA4B5
MTKLSKIESIMIRAEDEFHDIRTTRQAIVADIAFREKLDLDYTEEREAMFNAQKRTNGDILDRGSFETWLRQLINAAPSDILLL